MSDLISRQAAIDTLIEWYGCEPNGMDYFKEILAKKSSAQPEPSEITDEKAILHLQSTGWMQNHDREMYEMGLKEQLADDSDSYDSLMPSAQPEIVRCRECKHWEYDVIFADGWCREKHQGDPNWFCADGERKESNG